MLTKRFLNAHQTKALVHETMDYRDYRSGGRWRSAMSDDPRALKLYGSSVTSVSRPWSKEVMGLRDRLVQFIKHPLNFVLIPPGLRMKSSQ